MDVAKTSLKVDLRRLEIAFAILGLVVALYLVYYKLFPTSAFCVDIGDCEAVNISIYSEVLGIPVAAIGAAGYLAILVVGLLETRLVFFREWGPFIGVGLALAGFLYSGYLTYIELFVLYKICPYCVVSAVIMTGIFIIAAMRIKNFIK